MFHVAESKRKNEDLKMLLYAAGESKKQFKSKKSSKSIRICCMMRIYP